MPVSASPTPSATESGTASEYETRLSVTRAPSSRLATRVTSSAARSGSSRPTTAERTSSSRPLSSSARVCRVTRNMLISPATTAPNAVACQVTWPPIVSRARAGPAIATSAALPSIPAAARSSSACEA